MTGSPSAQIERLADGGIAIHLAGTRAALVPPSLAPGLIEMVEGVDDARGQRLMLAGIVAGISLAGPSAPPQKGGEVS